MKTPTRRDEPTDPGIDFPAAMQAVIAGERVTKAEWANADVYLFLDGRLKIHKADGTEADLIVSDGDMRGSDWVVLLNH